ncbi:hypothetical protein BD408DRAFT_439112 [Parasitella parasitica]|nr:hypothetical protein BD408DRAFT_439112 [Parasitella parasitica]
MNTYEFNDRQFDIKTTRSWFIYSKENHIDPIQIYRVDTQHFEIRDIDNNILFELNYKDIHQDIRFQYAKHAYLDETLLFFIAARSSDGIHSYLYLVNPLKEQSFHRLDLNRDIKGIVTNIFVSSALKNESRNDYHIVTLGTLDSAIYVFRITAEMMTEKQPLACALLRSDARNSITQQLIVLDTQSKSPADVYMMCGGSNGIIDFFLVKADCKVENEPIIDFVSHQLGKLPSNLPIVSIQCHKINDREVLLAISQELFNPNRISRSTEPSVSMLKFNTKKLVGKNITSMKFQRGTHIISGDIMTKECFQTRACYFDPDNGLLMMTQFEFDVNRFEFGEKTDTFLQGIPQDLQQVAVLDKNTSWVLGKQALQKLKLAKGLKRKQST